MRSAFNGRILSSTAATTNNTTNTKDNPIHYNTDSVSNNQLFNANTQLLFNHITSNNNQSKLIEPLSAINKHSNPYNPSYNHDSAIKHSESVPQQLSSLSITPSHHQPMSGYPHKDPPHGASVPSQRSAGGSAVVSPVAGSNPPSASAFSLQSLGHHLQSLVHGVISPPANNSFHSNLLTQTSPNYSSQSSPNAEKCAPRLVQRAKLGEVVSCLVNKWSAEFVEASKAGDVEAMCICQKFSSCKGFGVILESADEAKKLLDRIKEAGKLAELNEFYQENETTGDSSGSVSLTGYISGNISDRSSTPLHFLNSFSSNSSSAPNSAGNSGVSAPSTLKILPSISIPRAIFSSNSEPSSIPSTPTIEEKSINMHSPGINYSVPYTQPHLLEHAIICNPQQKNALQHNNNLSGKAAPPMEKKISAHISSPTESPLLSTVATPLSQNERRFSITI
jgi:hypothetical protein